MKTPNRPPSCDLPTKPGPYYWREKDGDEWEIHTVYIDDELNHTLMALCPIDDTWYATENWGGQWLPIPAAEELVELQAAKKMVDEGHEMYCVTNGIDAVSYLGKCESHAWLGAELVHDRDPDSLTIDDGYTCEPVTIVRKAKNDTERRTARRH
jgi:hypothetical protein